MKTKIYYKIIVAIPLYWLVCSQAFSQSSNPTKLGDDELKPVLKIEEEDISSRKGKKTNDEDYDNFKIKLIEVSSENKMIDINVKNSVDKSITNDGISLDISSSLVEQIKLTVDAGDLNTQTITIQNSGDSPLIWNVTPEGSEKLLYRLYVKDRILLNLNNEHRQKKNDVLTSEVFDAKETVLKMKSKENKNNSETFSSEQNFFIRRTNQNDLVNGLTDVNTININDNVELSNHLKVSTTNTTNEIYRFKDNKSDVHSPGLSDNMKVSENTDVAHQKVTGNSIDGRLQIFKQWFCFNDRGKPKFDPQVEVWEVSSDKGVHWMQILIINGESYVTNTKFFDPVFYLEYHIIQKRNSPYSRLTLLSEYVKQVERGPALSPKSGIIPANSSTNIEIQVDATSIEMGTYNPKFVLTDVTSLETIEVIPLHLNVVPESEIEDSKQLDKQLNGNQAPDKYDLSQNYPNPFNPSTKIKFSIPVTGQVKLAIYNLVGEEIAVLVNEVREAGFYEVTFNASNLPSGVYFYKIETGSEIQAKKMILMK